MIYATVSDRTVTIAGVDQLRARFNANAFSGRVEGGYRFVTPWMGLTPYAAGQFTTFDLPAYTEQALSGANTFALNYASKGVTATRSELGVRTDKSPGRCRTRSSPCAAAPRQLDDVVRRQYRANQIRLRRGVDFVQMMLGFRLRHKPFDALVESAVHDHVGTRAEGGAHALLVD
nr:autotransporter outer membrane beta-barrel domain-containing protein [Bradyrhizobium erythrophlei]